MESEGFSGGSEFGVSQASGIGVAESISQNSSFDVQVNDLGSLSLGDNSIFDHSVLGDKNTDSIFDITKPFSDDVVVDHKVEIQQTPFDKSILFPSENIGIIDINRGKKQDGIIDITKPHFSNYIVSHENHAMGHDDVRQNAELQGSDNEFTQNIDNELSTPLDNVIDISQIPSDKKQESILDENIKVEETYSDIKDDAISKDSNLEYSAVEQDEGFVDKTIAVESNENLSMAKRSEVDKSELQKEERIDGQEQSNSERTSNNSANIIDLNETFLEEKNFSLDHKASHQTEVSIQIAQEILAPEVAKEAKVSLQEARETLAVVIEQEEIRDVTKQTERSDVKSVDSDVRTKAGQIFSRRKKEVENLRGQNFVRKPQEKLLYIDKDKKTNTFRESLAQYSAQKIARLKGKATGRLVAEEVMRVIKPKGKSEIIDGLYEDKSIDYFADAVSKIDEIKDFWFFKRMLSAITDKYTAVRLAFHPDEIVGKEEAETVYGKRLDGVSANVNQDESSGELVEINVGKVVYIAKMKGGYPVEPTG